VQIEQMLVSELIPYASNARIHSKSQISQIAASIKEFGFNNPILCDGSKGIIAGHGRLLAAQKLGLEKLPVIELCHLSETQKKAFLLAENKLTDNGGWDKDVIQAELEALSIENFDISLTGFDLNDLLIKRDRDLDDKHTDQNCEMPIVPDFFENHQCFLIVTHSQIDEQFVREIFDLNKNYKSESGDKKERKTNVIDVENLRSAWISK